MIGVVLVSGADETKRVVSLLIIALLVVALLVAALTAWYWAHTNPRRRYRPAVPDGPPGSRGQAEPLPMRRAYEAGRPPYDPGRPPYDPARPTPDRLRQGPYNYGQQGADRQARSERNDGFGPFGRDPRLETDQFGNRYAPDPRRQQGRRPSRRP